MEHYIAVDNVTAWPNLTLMPNGDIIASIFNQPTHGGWEGDVECWASEDGGKLWSLRGTPAVHEPTTNRMNVAAGLGYDNTSIRCANKAEDPVWTQPGQLNEDPLPGDELMDQPRLCSSLDPTEYYEFCLDRMAAYQPEGFCFINNFYGARSLGCLGHPDEMKAALATGMPWGQAAGERMELTDRADHEAEKRT